MSGETGMVTPTSEANTRPTNAALEVWPLYPPTDNNLPLRLAAVHHFGGVSGSSRVFQTDVGLADWGVHVGEVAF